MGPRQAIGCCSSTRKPIDIAWSPCACSGSRVLPSSRLRPPAHQARASAAGSDRRCPRRGCPTLAPSCASASAMFTATVDLPTPPLPDATAIRFCTPAQRLQAVLHRVRDDRARQRELECGAAPRPARRCVCERVDRARRRCARSGSRTRSQRAQPSPAARCVIAVPPAPRGRPVCGTTKCSGVASRSTAERDSPCRWRAAADERAGL